MLVLEILLIIVNLVISVMYIKKAKEKVTIIALLLITVLGFGYGWIKANLFIMDAIYPEKQIHSGNLIMMVFLIITILIFIKLIIDILKNKKEGGKT